MIAAMKRRSLALGLGVALIAVPASMALALTAGPEGSDTYTGAPTQSGESPGTHDGDAWDSTSAAPSTAPDEDGNSLDPTSDQYIPCSLTDPCSPDV